MDSLEEILGPKHQTTHLATPWIACSFNVYFAESARSRLRRHCHRRLDGAQRNWMEQQQ